MTTKTISKGKQIERVLSKGQEAYGQNWVLAQFTKTTLTDQLTKIVAKEFAAVVGRVKSAADREKLRALCIVADITIPESLRNSHDNGTEASQS